MIELCCDLIGLLNMKYKVEESNLSQKQKEMVIKSIDGAKSKILNKSGLFEEEMVSS